MSEMILVLIAIAIMNVIYSAHEEKSIRDQKEFMQKNVCKVSSREQITNSLGMIDYVTKYSCNEKIK